MAHKSKISISHKPYDYSDVPGARPPEARVLVPPSLPSIFSSRSSVTESETDAEASDLAGLNVVIPNNYWAATALLNDAGAAADDESDDAAFEYPEPRFSVQNLDDIEAAGGGSSDKSKNVFAERIHDFKKSMKDSFPVPSSSVKRDWKYWNAVGLGLINEAAEDGSEQYNSTRTHKQSSGPRLMSPTSGSDAESLAKSKYKTSNWNRASSSKYSKPVGGGSGGAPARGSGGGRGRGRNLMDEIKRVDSFHRDETSIQRLGRRLQDKSRSAVRRDKSKFSENTNLGRMDGDGLPETILPPIYSSNFGPGPGPRIIAAQATDDMEPPPYRGKKISTLVAQRVLGPHGIRISVPPGSDNMTPLQQQMVAGTEHLPISRFLQQIPPPVPRTMEQLSRINARTKLPWRYSSHSYNQSQNQNQDQN